jgi:hypothetical protein
VARRALINLDVAVPLDEDHEQDASCQRLTDDAGILRVA